MSAVVEDGGEVAGGPAAVDVDGMGRVDSFEAVVQRHGAREHFGEHGVAFDDDFVVHDVQHPL